MGARRTTDIPLPSGPLPALLDVTAAGRTLISGNLGISVVSGTKGLGSGAWYAATGHPGVYVSILQPGMIAARILQGGEKTVGTLDENVRLLEDSLQVRTHLSDTRLIIGEDSKGA